MNAPAGRLSELTALDWIAVCLAAGGTLFCFQFPFFTAPQFALMFRDFGGALPLITRLALTLWFPLAWGTVPLFILGGALSGQRTLGSRRVMIVAAFLFNLLAGGVCLYAMYAPIFELAGKIKE